MVDFATLRTKMVDGQVRPSDVTDHRIIEAMLAIPREAFVEAGDAALAYLDRDVAVGASGRRLLQPMTLAKLVQAAAIGPEDVVLDVGCGTGYSSALLSRLASSVVALEDDPALAERAGSVLAGLGFVNVAVVGGPLPAGWPAEGPYDAILVNGAVEVRPDALVAQLKDGGRLVVVEGVGHAARGMLYVKSAGDVSGRIVMNAAVPLLPGFARTPAFAF